MSTIFKVYPQSREFPTFGEVACECRHQFNRFLTEFDLPAVASLFFDIHIHSRNEILPIPQDAAFQWSDDSYLWVGVDGIPGGTDGYFWLNDEDEVQYWREDIIPLERCTSIRSELESAIQVGYHWEFRRSAGQPGVVNILYGLLAGSAGILTNGFVFSDDCAWDYQRMPMRAQDFVSIYFRPDKETNVDMREWAVQSICWARDELNTLKSHQHKNDQ